MLFSVNTLLFGWAIGINAKEDISPHDIKALQALAEEKILKRYLCVSLEPCIRSIGEVTILPYG